MDVLPCDVITRPQVLGSDLIEYLTSTAAAGTRRATDDWDPFGEAAHLIDRDVWYTTSFDATPRHSNTRWLPPEGSGLPTVSVYSQACGSTVTIMYGSRGPRSRD